MKITTIKITSMEDAVKYGPFRRYSRFRNDLLEALGARGLQLQDRDGRRLESSLSTDEEIIQRLINNGDTTETLQGFLDLLLNPALKYITYKEFVIGTPDQAAIDELKALVQPYLLHKGTLLEPIVFSGKVPNTYRVVAYDDLIQILKARYQTITVAVAP
jgi:hypothetical protein